MRYLVLLSEDKIKHSALLEACGLTGRLNSIEYRNFHLAVNIKNRCLYHLRQDILNDKTHKIVNIKEFIKYIIENSL